MTFAETQLKSNGDKASTCFNLFFNRQRVRKMFAYSNAAVGFILTHFYCTWRPGVA